MRKYKAYTAQLEKLVNEYTQPNRGPILETAVDAALDGQPTKELFKMVSIQQIKRAGAYFTDKRLSNKLAHLILPELQRGSVILDPACGVGNLLLACSDHLPTSKGHVQTLKKWGKQLYGYDVHTEFVQAAKLRLILAALRRSQPDQSELVMDYEHLFPGLKLGDSFSENAEIEEAQCVILNPPYNPLIAPEGCVWGSGRVSGAAIWLDRWVDAVSRGTRLVAILPDVLRAGSSYEKWRKEIQRRTQIETIETSGLFGEHADVHVFLLALRKLSASVPITIFPWWTSELSTNTDKIVGDFFYINVGAVIPFRHLPRGQWHPYIQARQLLAWTEIKPKRKRRFHSTVYNPPFLVVRRTSRPEDRWRAVGTIITGSQPVAVENHLIIFRPKDGLLSTCRELLRRLKFQRTTDWLNERIRCRHLTIPTMQELPWWD
jgi:hypothetical protein